MSECISPYTNKPPKNLFSFSFQILEITRLILSLYQLWKNFDEKKEISGLLAKVPKPKISASR